MAAIYAGDAIVKWNSVAIGEARTFGLRRAANKIPTTPFKSDRYEEFLVGIITGTFTVSFNFKFSTHTALNADFQAGTARDLAIVLGTGDGSTFTVSAKILNFSVDLGQDMEQRGTIEAHATAAPTWI